MLEIVKGIDPSRGAIRPSHPGTAAVSRGTASSAHGSGLVVAEVHGQEADPVALDGRLRIEHGTVVGLDEQQHPFGLVVGGIAATGLRRQVGVELLQVATVDGGPAVAVDQAVGELGLDHDAATTARVVQHDVNFHDRQKRGRGLLRPKSFQLPRTHLPALTAQGTAKGAADRRLERLAVCGSVLAQLRHTARPGVADGDGHLAQ